MRALVTTLVSAAVMTAACTHGAKPTAPESVSPAIDITAAAAKPTFGTAEPVTLTVTLTNTGPRSCRVADAALGALTVVGFTRDGTPVAPSPTTATFINGFPRAVAAALTDLAPGATAQFPFASTDGALNTYAGTPSGDADVSRWPVGALGHYVMTIGYLRPPLAGVPDDECQTSAHPAQVAFTVTERS